MIAIGIVLRRLRGPLGGAGVAAFCATARAGSLGLPDAMTRITAESYELHLYASYAALALGLVAFCAMLLTMHAHRRSSGRSAAPFHRSATVETLWALIPWAVIAAAAWPAATALARIEDPERADITIRAKGLQWKWGYEYVKGEGEGIAFDSNVYAPRRPVADAAAPPGSGRLDVDNPVVVPAGRRIRMVLEAKEEIHSWHVPSLGVKQYAVPGLVRDTWFHAGRVGTHRGLCSIEACGAGRACVLIVVKVVSDADYRRWVEARRRAGGGVPGEIRTQAPQPPPGEGARAAT